MIEQVTKIPMKSQRFKSKTDLATQKIIRLTLFGIIVSTMLGHEFFRPARVEAELSNPSGKIISGKYWVGGTGMALIVQGDRYYYEDETGRTEWRPVSRLKYVKDGIVFGEGDYWCLSTLPGERGMCTPLGWKNPASQQDLRCNQALIAAHEKLLKVKRMTSLTLTPVQVAARYPDRPIDRSDGYNFLMIGKGGYDVLASERLTQLISTAILTNCPTVSMVSFSAYPEGEATYGWVNNQMKLFDCYDAFDLGLSPNPKPPWGYEACYP